MSKRSYQTALAAGFGAALFIGGAAQAANLPVHKIGRVEYLSGGIGKNESTAILAASKAWPLTLEFAEKDGQHADFVADVDVVVHDAAGHPVLQAEAGGPLMLAKLAPGRYNVEATLAGKTLREPVVVKQGEPARVTFVWPAGTENASSRNPLVL